MSIVLGDALSLLLFRLHSGRLLGINLLKVQEIIPCPALTKLPSRHPHVRGVATLRGSALTVIDLGKAIGEQGVPGNNDGCLIVTELSRSRQGLHVQSVERIVQCYTRDVRPPPAGSGSKAFITGVTQIDGKIVQILDIEKVLHELAPAMVEDLDEQLLSESERSLLRGRRVLLVEEHAAGRPIEVLVSDIEMPEMDGYDLVRTIRKHPDIGQTYVLLHTSLDSTMNTEKARAVGANDVLTKFSTVDLSKALVHAFESLQ